MDNLSHSLVGLAGGELIHRALPTEPDSEAMRLRRRLLLFACWFASNFPDLDLILTPLLPEPLGYLLHHRGHTHTFLYALPQALLVFASIWLAVPAARPLLGRSRPARVGMLLAIAAGLTLHLAMDYLNSYGLHPFHPFDSRWFYGDMVFIVEPVFWVAFGIPLIMMLPKPWLRRTLLGALPAILLYFTVRGFLLWTSFAVLELAGLLLAFLQRREQAAGMRGLLACFVLALTFIALQAVMSQQAHTTLARLHAARFPSSQLRDIALTPFPVNPLCWTFVSVESDEAADRYHLRSGLLSLAPNLLPAARCPASLIAAPIAPEAAQDVVFLDHYAGSLDALRALNRRDCHIAAWLRFARAPRIGADSASDMRFSFRSVDNFTTLRFAEFAHKACALYVPPWEPPRRDLLREPQR